MAHHADHSHNNAHAGHGDHGHHEDAAHGGPALYWAFAVILGVITFCEWLIFDKRLDWGIATNVMVPALLALSLIKFVMVVGWYMHLRYDPGWMKKIFVVSLVMGGGTAIILHVLMG